MYYKFRVETTQSVDNDYGHTIAKKASSTEEAIMEILRDAIVRGFSIDKIEFVGQYLAEPMCPTTFRKVKIGNIVL